MGKWLDIDSAPTDGSRIRVGHHRDASSMKVDTICPIYGSFVGGRWQLSSFFVVPPRHLSDRPTHWFPEDSAGMISGEAERRLLGEGLLSARADHAAASRSNDGSAA